MPTEIETNQPSQSLAETETAPPASQTRTVGGWQGIRCVLPPDWNVTGFSMEHESGYLRVDAPGNSALTVQIRWMDAASQGNNAPTLYNLLASRVRKLLRRPEPPTPKPDLKGNLERVLKETARQAKKAKSRFESSIKPEKTEGEHDERMAINFTWSGNGRGQGKIWHCATCNRVVIAQVVGAAKDQHAIADIASQLFASLHDHSDNGYTLWALYDLQAQIPQDFRLETQKLLSGYLHLAFARGGEKILLDRWGLANMTLKKFTLGEWFANNAAVRLKGLQKETFTTPQGHEAERYSGRLSLFARIRALRESLGALGRIPTRFEGSIWACAESNKIYALQVLHSARTEGLLTEVVNRCVCH